MSFVTAHFQLGTRLSASRRPTASPDLSAVADLLRGEHRDRRGEQPARPAVVPVTSVDSVEYAKSLDRVEALWAEQDL